MRARKTAQNEQGGSGGSYAQQQQTGVQAVFWATRRGMRFVCPAGVAVARPTAGYN